MLGPLTVNGAFIDEFCTAGAPCFALGMVEEGKRQYALMALRLEVSIPREVCTQGLCFGHAVLGTDSYDVVQFLFDFEGFARFNALMNPNNPVTQAVVTAMVESGDYCFMVFDPDGNGNMYFSQLEPESLTALKERLPRIRRSKTRDAQYEETVAYYTRNPGPAGTLMRWVCYDDAGYLDLTKDRFEL